MVERIDYRQLQDLADLLDLNVGVELRKNILRGNEQLTLSTDKQSWTSYFSEVITRLNRSVDEEKRRKILRNLEPLLISKEKVTVGHSTN